MEFPRLEVVVPDILSLPDEEYALLRRQGLGASDASVYLGLQSKWKTKANLIAEKQRTELTDEERAIGQKEVVRKGKDLEPLILNKAASMLGAAVTKPTAMFKIKEYPYLTINFDGVMDTVDGPIPVEAKFVSQYGDKYYNREHAYMREFGKLNPDNTLHKFPIQFIEYCEEQAQIIGIPAYYYAQVQQQMLGLGSSYGYLSALHDKGWELCIYRVPRDETVIRQIIMQGYSTWNLIQKK